MLPASSPYDSESNPHPSPPMHRSMELPNDRAYRRVNVCLPGKWNFNRLQVDLLPQTEELQQLLRDVGAPLTPFHDLCPRSASWLA